LLKPANLLTFFGTLVLLATLSNSALVATGSAGHWGFLVAAQDGQEEVVGEEMTSEVQTGSNDGVDEEFLVPMDEAPVRASTPTGQDQTQTPKPLAELDPFVIYQPEEIDIPAIGLHAPVVLAKSRIIKLDGKRFQQWLPPAQFAAGWHYSSATLGLAGNTVLNGHNNLYGGVFDGLRNLKAGDRVEMTAQGMAFIYEVTNVLNLPEKYESVETRIENASWLQPSEDERLTLVTCWPPEHNKNRLIVVAKPVERYLVPVEGAAVAPMK
jgi:LPXTG-site transpeptidase (sortase) family protein